MYFFADFEAASQGILEEVDQEEASEDAEKDAKSGVLEYWDRFILINMTKFDFILKKLENS
jgi:hypothetical protein